MATRLPTATRNAKADAVGTLMSGGSVEILKNTIAKSLIKAVGPSS